MLRTHLSELLVTICLQTSSSAIPPPPLLLPPAAISFIILERVLFPLDSRPHLLEMSEHSHVGIHEAVHAVLHAGLFVSVELSGADLAGDALSEARVGQGVNCCL